MVPPWTLAEQPQAWVTWALQAQAAEAQAQAAAQEQGIESRHGH